MSLSRFTSARLVVQHLGTSLYDAIRAMEDNHIGCVLVQDGDQIGVVTDRDIALEVVAFELDPVDATLGEIVSTPASVLPVTASVKDAATLMLERHVRRIPIVDGRRLVGIVTLDDLILDQALDPPTLASIVRAQLSEPSRLKRQGQPRPTRPSEHDEAQLERRARRRVARAKASYEMLIERTLRATGLELPERAIVALHTAVSALAQRIQPEEAEHLLSQLPRLLRERVANPAARPDRSITRKAIAEALAVRLKVDESSADEILCRVGGVLCQAISPGELADVRAQLPAELREILEPRAAAD